MRKTSGVLNTPRTWSLSVRRLMDCILLSLKSLKRRSNLSILRSTTADMVEDCAELQPPGTLNEHHSVPAIARNIPSIGMHASRSMKMKF